MGRVALITGVSASGKTTIQNELMKKGWVRPVNFTTRKPRDTKAFEVDEDGDYTSEELSEYVFISKDTFLRKMKNGDFLEVVEYGGNLYGVSSVIPKYNNVVIILDPSGRAQALNKLKYKGYNVKSYYIDLNPRVQEERLRERGSPEEEILKRRFDYEWFYPTPKCIRLSGTAEVSTSVKIIEGM